MTIARFEKAYGNKGHEDPLRHGSTRGKLDTHTHRFLTRRSLRNFVGVRGFSTNGSYLLVEVEVGGPP